MRLLVQVVTDGAIVEQNRLFCHHTIRARLDEDLVAPEDKDFFSVTHNSITIKRVLSFVLSRPIIKRKGGLL